MNFSRLPKPNLPTARAGNRRFARLSALRAHTNAPHKNRVAMENAKERRGRVAAPGGGRGQRKEMDHMAKKTE